MKTIYLIKDKSPLWEELADYLKTVNAEVIHLKEKSVVDGLSKTPPHLIILSEIHYEAISNISKNIPKIIIKDSAVQTGPEVKAKDTYFLSWPIDKAAFLEITSRLLYISERRLFNALITVTLKDKNESYMGSSENFSLTGVAFKVDAALNTGMTVTISFFVPNLGKRVNLDAEVVRTSLDPVTGLVYYGARFLNLTPEAKAILSQFVNNKA